MEFVESEAEKVNGLTEQNALLRKQIELLNALVGSRECEMKYLKDKCETVNDKLELILNRSIPTIAVGEDDDDDLNEHLEDECVGSLESSEKPSSSRDYVIESRAKEAYWRRTLNDQYNVQMANSEFFLNITEQYFSELFALR